MRWMSSQILYVKDTSSGEPLYACNANSTVACNKILPPEKANGNIAPSKRVVVGANPYRF